MTSRFQHYLEDYNTIFATYFHPGYKYSLYNDLVDAEGEKNPKLGKNCMAEELSRVMRKRQNDSKVDTSTPGHSTESEDGTEAGNTGDASEKVCDDELEAMDFDTCMDELLSKSNNDNKPGSKRKLKKTNIKYSQPE